MAHSLGSVLTYDILCNQPDLYSALNVKPLPRDRQSKAPVSLLHKMSLLSSEGAHMRMLPEQVTHGLQRRQPHLRPGRCTTQPDCGVVA